ncbi:hypothetical protein KR084_003519 [Drosophila pseudotakahashii]|nr:hypothetical protein KR084_003519 [Drosophila pseudotakahashii]
MTLTMHLSSLFDNPNCLLSRRNRYQFLVTLLVNIAPFCHGLGVGWMSPVMRDLPTNQSPLDFPVLVEDVSWIGSLVGIGSMLGNILAGTLMNRIGRKLVMLGIAFPYMMFWCMIYFVQSVEFLYVGRLLAGMTGGAVYVVLPTFLSEIADDKIRGRLGSMILLTVNTGVLTGYIVSSNFNYFSTPPFIIILPLCYFAGNFLFPETPHHLIRKGKFAEAEKSFRFYKNIKRDDIKAESEFEDLKMRIIQVEKDKANSFNFRDFVTKPAFRAYTSAIVLMIANQFSASFCVSSYLSTIFAASHTTLNLTLCTIVIGSVQIVGTYVTTLLCDKYGRRILMLVSSLGSSVCLAAFGCFTYFAQDYDLSAVGWLPLVILSCYVCLVNIGLVGCVFVLLLELFPAKIRSVCVSTFTVMLSGTVFLAMKIFPICVAEWGISVTMSCCSFSTILCFFYFYFFLEETKGKSLLEG